MSEPHVTIRTSLQRQLVCSLPELRATPESYPPDISLTVALLAQGLDSATIAEANT